MKKLHIVSIAAFVVGLIGFQTYARKVKEEASGGEPRQVLVVTRDLKLGASLTKDCLGVVTIPSDYLDPRRILEKEKPHLIGVQINQSLRAGDGIVWSDISDGAAHKHLAALVSPGMRAYSIEGEANPLGGLLRVGDHVDVLLESRGEARLLLERVLVLAVGGQMNRVDDGEPVPMRASGVTLSVTSPQAEDLLLAERAGELRLALRNPDDLRKQTREEGQGDPEPGRAPVLKATRDSKKEIEHVR